VGIGVAGLGFRGDLAPTGKPWSAVRGIGWVRRNS
jgi:hypothetical protein